jgi:catechol 2,3-dioxygenase
MIKCDHQRIIDVFSDRTSPDTPRIMKAAIGLDITREGPVTIIKPALHHVTFRTTRLAEMIDWYSKVVGAQVNFQDQVAAWTSNDAANHRVAFLAVPGLSDDPDKKSHNALHHSAFEYESFADLMASYKRLADIGIHPAFCLDHGLTVSIYYKDPDENYVELQSDAFGDWAKSTEWMRTSADFAANPIGTFFDPAKVYEAHKSGRSDDDLHRAMRAGDFQPATIPDIGLPG